MGTRIMARTCCLILGALVPVISVSEGYAAQSAASQQSDLGSGRATADPSAGSFSYILGPLDQLNIWVLGLDEFTDKPFRVDSSGMLDLPLISPVRAQGLTVELLKEQLTERFKPLVLNPRVSISVTEFHSHPVSVFGAVTSPGVHALSGNQTLIEAISMAGGFRQDAGHTVRITRESRWGKIPLASAVTDVDGHYSTASVSVTSLMSARHPEENIIIKPNDVISVPRAELVYVVGEVLKAGGFVLNERESMTVLQALSLAEGLSRNAAPAKAKILRETTGQPSRLETPVNLKQILAGKMRDVPLEGNDILFIPNSLAKSAANRAVETAINVGSGIAIWRH